MPDDRIHQQRGTLLSVLFSLAVAGSILFFLFLLCGGFSLYALPVAAGFALLGYFHYWSWGRSLNRQVAGEREELEIRESLEAEERLREEP
jgi:hypothetical protein